MDIVDRFAQSAARIDNAKTDIVTAITAKGVTVPGGAKIDDLPSYIGQISSGSGGNVATGTMDLTYASSSITVTGLDFTPTSFVAFVASDQTSSGSGGCVVYAINTTTATHIWYDYVTSNLFKMLGTTTATYTPGGVSVPAYKVFGDQACANATWRWVAWA